MTEKRATTFVVARSFVTHSWSSSSFLPSSSSSSPPSSPWCHPPDLLALCSTHCHWVCVAVGSGCRFWCKDISKGCVWLSWCCNHLRCAGFVIYWAVLVGWALTACPIRTHRELAHIPRERGGAHGGQDIPGGLGRAACHARRVVGGWLKEEINHLTVDLGLKLRRHARDYSRSRRLCSRLEK